MDHSLEKPVDVGLKNSRKSIRSCHVDSGSVQPSNEQASRCTKYPNIALVALIFSDSVVDFKRISTGFILTDDLSANSNHGYSRSP